MSTNAEKWLRGEKNDVLERINKIVREELQHRHLIVDLERLLAGKDPIAAEAYGAAIKLAVVLTELAEDIVELDKRLKRLEEKLKEGEADERGRC